MASVTVDFVAMPDSDGVWTIVLVEQGPWSAPVETHLRRLQDRLYGCIDAVLDGQLAAQFPLTAGLPIRIQVDGYDLPELETRAFFDRFADGALQTPDYAAAACNNRFVSSIEFVLNLGTLGKVV